MPLSKVKWILHMTNLSEELWAIWSFRSNLPSTISLPSPLLPACLQFKKARRHSYLSTGQCCYSVYLEDVTVLSQKANTAYVAEVLDHKMFLKCWTVFYTIIIIAFWSLINCYVPKCISYRQKTCWIKFRLWKPCRFPQSKWYLTKEIMVFKAHAFHVEQKQEQETFHVRCSMIEEK